jgi:hypothetical protein
MACFELVRDRPGDVVECELAGFLGDARLEDDLEQQVAELVADLRRCRRAPPVGHFVGFLDRVWDDRLETLRAIPSHPFSDGGGWP